MPPTSISRVKLFLRQTLDLALFEKGFEVWLRRVMVLVCFKTQDGWTQPYEAIVDTGAPLSILPVQIWEKIERKDLHPHEVSGIVPGVSIPVQAAEISACLMDPTHTTPAFRFKAYLSQEKHIPLILGFDGILSHSVMHLDAARNQGYLEFP